MQLSMEMSNNLAFLQSTLQSKIDECALQTTLASQINGLSSSVQAAQSQLSTGIASNLNLKADGTAVSNQISSAIASTTTVLSNAINTKASQSEYGPCRNSP